MSRVVCLLSAICFLLTACVQQQTLDRTHFFIASAYDDAGKDRIEITLAVPMFQSGKPNSVEDEWYTRIGHTGSGIREFMNAKLDKPINTGMLSVVLFGKDVAINGLANKLDVLLRNAVYSRRMYLAVVDGKAKDVLKSPSNHKAEKGIYLHNLIHSNVRKGLIPGQNLHEFEYAELGKGMDPFLPLLRLQNGRIVVAGTALFKNDQYIAFLDENESRLMKLLLSRMNQGIFETKLGDGRYVAVENVGSKAKYRLRHAAHRPVIDISLRMKAKIREAEPRPYPSRELREIRDLLEHSLSAAESELVKRFQTEGIDPLGLGDFARSRTRKWKEEDWNKVYPTLKVNVAVKMNLVETGIKR